MMMRSPGLVMENTRFLCTVSMELTKGSFLSGPWLFEAKKLKI